MLASGLESPYAEWITRWEERGERTITTQVPCGPYFEQRDKALQVLRGSVTLNGQALETGDGAAISAETLLTIAATANAEVMLFDLA